MSKPTEIDFFTLTKIISERLGDLPPEGFEKLAELALGVRVERKGPNAFVIQPRMPTSQRVLTIYLNGLAEDFPEITSAVSNIKKIVIGDNISLYQAPKFTG